MKCGRCRRVINGPEQSKAKVVKEGGRIKAVYHFKCWSIMQRTEYLRVQEREAIPTAYEAKADYRNADDLTSEARQRREKAEQELEALKRVQQQGVDRSPDGVNLDELISQHEHQVELARRQEEIAAEQEKESRPEGWSDWRDPSSYDV